MPSRAEDWYRQAVRDLQHARHAFEDEELENLPPPFIADDALKDVAKELDKHYIPPRYPNSYPQGAPYEYYTRGEAERAITHAERVLTFCENHVSRQSGNAGTGEAGGESVGPPEA